MYGTVTVPVSNIVLIHYDTLSRSMLQTEREQQRFDLLVKRFDVTSFTKVNQLSYSCEVVTKVKDIAGHIPAYLVTSVPTHNLSKETVSCFDNIFEVRTLSDLKRSIGTLRTVNKGMVVNAVYSVLDTEYNKQLYPHYISRLFAQETRHIDVSFLKYPDNLTITIISVDPFGYLLNVGRLKALGYDPNRFLNHAVGLTKGRK